MLLFRGILITHKKRVAAQLFAKRKKKVFLRLQTLCVYIYPGDEAALYSCIYNNRQAGCSEQLPESPAITTHSLSSLSLTLTSPRRTQEHAEHPQRRQTSHSLLAPRHTYG